MRKTIPLEQMSYEQAFSELEGIVTALEAAQTSLEEALSLYKRGQNLAAYCSALLEKAEIQIRQVEDAPSAGDD
ncbi:MAG: exodeoxyribonuclease VII small subunit [Anaerolineaceae bacterium]|nr:exodeoxyribonuclease VII small subunit [Anaerolineaceae bacterium]